MSKAKARVIVMKGFVEYARVFKENMDSNPDFHPTGQFNMNFYPETEADLQMYWDAGVAEEFRGHKRLKDPRSGDGYGIGQYIRLKRDNVNPIAETLGGAPQVVNWSGDELTKVSSCEGRLVVLRTPDPWKQDSKFSFLQTFSSVSQALLQDCLVH